MQVTSPTGPNLRGWFAENVTFVEGSFADLFGVPASDVQAVVGAQARRLGDQASGDGPRRLQTTGANFPLDFSVTIRNTDQNTHALGDYVIRTAYGSNYTTTGSGAYAGNALVDTMIAKLQAQGLPVPDGLAQASMTGSAPVFVVSTTPQDPFIAVEEGSSTALIAYAASGVVGILVCGICSVWCWKKSRVVTEGKHCLEGDMHADFLIKRSDGRMGTMGSVLGRTVSRRSTEKTEQGKTIVQWTYDQDELLRRHKSFQAQLSARSSGSTHHNEVVINVDPGGPSNAAPSAIAASNNGGQEDDMAEEGLEIAQELSCSVPYKMKCHHTKQALLAFPIGSQVEYYSRTHGKWAPAVISRSRNSDAFFFFFDVRVGQQIRTEVSLACLRPVLKEGMPVFACTQRQRVREDETSPRHRGPAVKEVWKPAVVHGRQRSQATRVGYCVELVDERPSPRRDSFWGRSTRKEGRVVALPPHRLRRRFPANTPVDVYRGPERGWKTATVHASAVDSVVTTMADAGLVGLRSSGDASMSPSLYSDSEGSCESYDEVRRETMEVDPSAFSAQVSTALRRRLKDREEEGQLVPIIQINSGTEEPEWVPGYLLRHSKQATDLI